MLHRENRIRPYHVTSAADLIKETMAAHHVTETDLASRIGSSQKYVSDVLQRKEYLNAKSAIKLAYVMGLSSRLLLNLDSSYRLHRAESQLRSQHSLNPDKRYRWARA